MVGPTTEYKAYLKVKTDIDAGRKQPNNWFHEKDAIYKDMFIEPSPYLYNAWATFWDIRTTKFDETPITHQDILAYITLMKKDMLPQEVSICTTFDTYYYKYLAKYKKA